MNSSGKFSPILLLCSGFCAVSIPALAAEFQLQGEARLRYESKAGGGANAAVADFQRVGVDNDNDYAYLRTTLAAEWLAADGWKLRLALRDNRVWSDDRSPSPRNDELDIYEAWAERSFSGGWKLAVGRQEINLSSRVLVGVANNNNGRSFDAIQLNSRQQDFRGQLFVGRVVSAKRTRLNSSTDNPMVTGAMVGFDNSLFGQTIELSLSTQHNGSNKPSGYRDLYALHLRLLAPKSAAPWDWDVDVAYQGGQLNRGVRRYRQDAFFVNGKAGYTFGDSKLKPRLGVDIYWSPGDSDANDGRLQTWDLWYVGGNHSRAGRMDLVSIRNIRSVGVTGNLLPVSGMALTAAVYQHWLDDTRDWFYPASGGGRNGMGYGRDATLPRTLGTEINLTLRYTLAKPLVLYVEAGTFLRGSYIDRSLDDRGGARNAHYLQANLTYRY